MLTKDDVQVSITVNWSEEDPHDYIDDPILLDWINGQILVENTWAWGCVKVTVFWRNLYYVAHCTPVTVHGQEDFMKSYDYKYAVQECLDWIDEEAKGIIINYPA